MFGKKIIKNHWTLAKNKKTWIWASIWQLNMNGWTMTMGEFSKYGDAMQRILQISFLFSQKLQQSLWTERAWWCGSTVSSLSLSCCNPIGMMGFLLNFSNTHWCLQKKNNTEGPSFFTNILPWKTHLSKNAYVSLPQGVSSWCSCVYIYILNIYLYISPLKTHVHIFMHSFPIVSPLSHVLHVASHELFNYRSWRTPRFVGRCAGPLLECGNSLSNHSIGF